MVAEPGAADSQPPHRTVVAGLAVALPLPDGHCVLDPANPTDRANYQDPAARVRGSALLAAALSCDPDKRSDAGFAAGRGLYVTWAAARTATGDVLPQSLDKPAFLARIERNAANALAAGPHEIRQANGRDTLVTRLTAAGRDTDAVYLRVDTEVISPSGSFTLCGHQALTMVRSIYVILTVARVCQPGDADLAGPVVRGLVQRAAEANP